jgi:archaellum biogenesis ATPase FlaH
VKDVGIAYAYYKHDSRESQTPDRIIASFIKQLCHNQETIPEFLLEFHRKHDDNVETPTTMQLITQLYHLSRGFREIFVIIDALDESAADQRDIILDFLTNFIHAIPHAKIFVTSRKERDIEQHFTSIKIPIIPIEAKDVGEDIKYLSVVAFKSRCKKGNYISEHPN